METTALGQDAKMQLGFPSTLTYPVAICHCYMEGLVLLYFSNVREFAEDLKSSGCGIKGLFLFFSFFFSHYQTGK